MRTVPHWRSPGRTAMRRLHRFAGLLALALCLTLAPATPASAQVNWEEQQFRDRLFSAHMRAHATGLQGLKDMVVSVAAMDWRVANPYATTADISRHMARVRTAVDAQYIADVYGSGAYTALVKLVDAASRVPGVNIATPGLKILLESTIGENLAQTAAIENQVTGAYQTNMYLTQLYGVQDTAWGQVSRLGQQDPAFTAAWNGMIGGRAGVVLDASTDQLLADPLLATYINVEAILMQQHDQAAFLQETRRQVQAALTALDAKNDAIIAQLQASSLQYPVGPGPKPTPQAYTQARAQAAERQVELDALGSGLFVLSTLAGFVDPELGADIATLGKAGLAVATAVNNYLPTIAGLSVGQALSSLSTMALTGNILGAVMTILPMFSSGPTPDQLILEQMRELRLDIANLGTQMNARFDAIEQALTVVYADITTQLNRLDGAIIDVRARLGDIQQTLLLLDSKVDTLALFTAHALQDLNLGELRSDINGYINYQQRTGDPFPDYTTYGKVENTFHLAATGKSRESVFVETSAGDTVDPVTAIGKFGPTGTVSYLSWLAANRYGTAVSVPAVTVPSASVFQLAARAYLALQLQNPAYAQRMAASRSADVQSVGNAYLTATRALSAPAAGGATNNTFTGLVTDYNNSSVAVSNALLEIRQRVATGGGYSAFGPADQAPGTRIANTSVPVCTGTGPALGAPGNAANATLPNTYHVAALATPDDGKPKFSSCWTAAWVDTQGDEMEALWGSVQITFVNRVEWPGQAPRDIRTVTAKKNVGQICTFNAKTGQKCKVPRDEVNSFWNSTYKPLLEQSGQVAVDPSAAEDASRRTASALYGKQLQYYQVVRAELGGETVLGRANRALTETIALIQTYTELAFPKALEGNATLNALLYGNQRLIGDQVLALPGTSSAYRLRGLSDAFARAQTNYAGCEPTAPGRPCKPGFTPNVKSNQAAPFDVDCPVADAVGEHIANCLAGYRQPRADLLAVQYARHSKELADGGYVEGSPQVEAIVAELQAVNGIVHRVTPLSQGRPVTSSSVETQGGGFEARYAVDGDSTTRWSSKETNQEWLQVDLGSTRQVGRIVLEWEVAYGRAYEIQTSPDGVTWTTISSITTGTGGTQVLNVSGTGRYVRMYGTQRGTQYGFSLWEFQVYAP